VFKLFDECGRCQFVFAGDSSNNLAKLTSEPGRIDDPGSFPSIGDSLDLCTQLGVNLICINELAGIGLCQAFGNHFTKLSKVVAKFAVTLPDSKNGAERFTF
jgi:hypothetical protein